MKRREFISFSACMNAENSAIIRVRETKFGMQVYVCYTYKKFK